MPGERRPGMDHEHYEWSPIVSREALRWANGARVALCVIVNLEHMEWRPPESRYEYSTLAGGVSPRPYPDYARLSHREYGHRVGVFRVLDVLEKHGVKPTIAMDALTAENYPYLVRYCLDRGCEIIGHGISVSRMITGGLAEQDEREYIRTSISAIERAAGSAPRGWLGPEYGESTRTPELLAEAGIQYVCDWVNDEQPYPITTPALPVMLELDDVNALWERRVDVERYAQMLEECFETMYADAGASGRLLALNLHPWLIGQPFRIGYLDEALGHMTRRDGVWAATGSEIVSRFRA